MCRRILLRISVLLFPIFPLLLAAETSDNNPLRAGGETELISPAIPPEPSKGGSGSDRAKFEPGQIVEIDIGKGAKMKFCWIPKGEVQLGSKLSESGRTPWELESSRGIFRTGGFWMAKYPVTQHEYQVVVGKNPSYHSKSGAAKMNKDTSRYPVEMVNWEDAHNFVKKLKVGDEVKKLFGPGAKFALPSLDQWEYACRGGRDNEFPFYFGYRLNGKEANINGSFPYLNKSPGPLVGHTTEVGSYEKVSPHPYSLCDMCGNVRQWCDKADDGEETKMYYLKGGCWSDTAEDCRTAARHGQIPTQKVPHNGFRIIVSIDE